MTEPSQQHIAVAPTMLGCDIDLITRLHQFAFNPSVLRPNPYIDVSKLDLSEYVNNVFGQETLEPSAAGGAKRSPRKRKVSAQINLSEFLNTTDENFAFSPLRNPYQSVASATEPAKTPLRTLQPQPLFNNSNNHLGVAQTEWRHQRKISTGNLTDYALQTPIPRLSLTSFVSPVSDVFGSDLDSPLSDAPFLGALGTTLEDGLSVNLKVETTNSQDSLDSYARGTSPCDSHHSKASPTYLSPIPTSYHGLPTPEEQIALKRAAMSSSMADYTPLACRQTSRSYPYQSLAMTASKKLEKDLLEADEHENVRPKRTRDTKDLRSKGRKVAAGMRTRTEATRNAQGGKCKPKSRRGGKCRASERTLWCILQDHRLTHLFFH
ncbi:hypothetical protein BC832DRAFT_546465 [Gaertneriomyces semiglobifer]|nr:hypothetical protein BC832DRAFT_546465 [Gaertneriomyces semiglobifer]